MIKNISLRNFRNHKSLDLELSDDTTIIFGKNASGKTNILEAINYLATGKSFKARRETEVIQYKENIASVNGLTSDNKNLDIKITTGENDWPKKRLLVDGVPKRLIDFAGHIKTVLFAPQDMDLVTQSPGLRRKFLDHVLSQVDREYHRSLISYEKGIRQRNRLLFRIREEGLSRSQLLFWNQLVIKEGNYIFEKRREFIDFINNLDKCNLKYDFSAISEARLDQYKDAEIASAQTLVGPHRDDFTFFDSDRDLSLYGSRGEQRMAVLWLKMAELEYINEPAVLLLDYIFSELDHIHRDLVLELVKNQQTIITVADEHFVETVANNKSKIINL